MLTVLMPCFGVAILITSIVLYATANDLNIGTCAKWRGGGSIWLEDFDHKKWAITSRLPERRSKNTRSVANP